MLYLPIIANFILFFQLNSSYINFNYYTIHLCPIIYTNQQFIVHSNFITSHQLTLSQHIPNSHHFLTVSLFTFPQSHIFICLFGLSYNSQSLNLFIPASHFYLDSIITHTPLYIYILHFNTNF